MSQDPDNLLAALHAAWTQSPHKLLSLRDMIKATSRPFLFLTILECRKQLALKATEALGLGKIAESEVIYGLEKQLEEFREFCEAIDAPAATDHAVRFWARLNFAESTGDPITNEVVASQIEDLQVAFWYEMGGRNFVFLHPGAEDYFEQEALFGTEVDNAFPNAKQDIKEAGNCLACDLYTAAVFHLMRVTEHGLRALARRLGIRKVKKHVPVHFATWDEMLKEIWARIDALEKTTRGGPRQTKVDFYKAAHLDLRALKDLRNKTMHTRGPFSENGALDALAVVHDFMQRLAKFGIKG